MKDYTGSPPACRPECLVSSECQQTKACINQKCVDPCVEPYPCGRQAVCNVINHNPICSCPEHFTGDPFSNCVELKSNFKYLKYLGKLSYSKYLDSKCTCNLHNIHIFHFKNV